MNWKHLPWRLVCERLELSAIVLGAYGSLKRWDLVEGLGVMLLKKIVGTRLLILALFSKVGHGLVV